MNDVPALPCSPENLRLYVIGDIHGRLDLLTHLIDQIKTDVASTPALKNELIFLGDYIDRGMESKGVLDFLLTKLPPKMSPVFLRGNHEEYFLRFLEGNLGETPNWLLWGGTATLASYGLQPFAVRKTEDFQSLHQEALRKIPTSHHVFLTQTLHDCTRGDYFFVHAGIRPDIPLDQQSVQDRLSIRGPFLNSDADHSKIIVHGHTIAPEPDVQSNRIGVDTGAFASGRLTCLVLYGTTQRFLST